MGYESLDNVSIIVTIRLCDVKHGSRSETGERISGNLNIPGLMLRYLFCPPLINVFHNTYTAAGEEKSSRKYPVELFNICALTSHWAIHS
jgi:hypothetical protein